VSRRNRVRLTSGGILGLLIAVVLLALPAPAAHGAPAPRDVAASGPAAGPAVTLLADATEAEPDGRASVVEGANRQEGGGAGGGQEAGHGEQGPGFGGDPGDDGELAPPHAQSGRRRSSASPIRRR
jgi:hypothetical protein